MMSEHERLSMRYSTRPMGTLAPASAGILQRKFACGGSASAGGECEECKKRTGSLERKAASGYPQSGDSSLPIVRDVLGSAGQPLDDATRLFFEPRFGHDFGRVRVHTDSKAAESAQAVNALAYAVGSQIVFGQGKYSPRTAEGKHLLAHELMHVVQQGDRAVSLSDLTVGPNTDAHEVEADRAESLVWRFDSCEQIRGPRIASRTGTITPRSGAVLQRKVPTGISLKETHSFGHAEFKSEEDKKNILTSIGDVSLMQLLPAGDYSAEQKRGECTKEFLTEVSNTCPPTKEFCTGNRCLEVGRYGSAGDAKTGIMVSDGPDCFIDRHIHRQPDSLLPASGKNKCSVVCHQMYKYRTEPDKQYHDLGAFYIIRNFQAGTFTPSGGTAINITTGGIQKVPAPFQAPSKDDFAKNVAPGLAKAGTLLDAPPVLQTTTTPVPTTVPKKDDKTK